MIEALKNVVCPSCGGPDQFDGDTYLKEQKLREENAHLREEVGIIGAVIFTAFYAIRFCIKLSSMLYN